MPSDIDTPYKNDLIEDMKFTEDNLSRIQLALLSLIPPNDAILSTMRLKQTRTYVIDFESIRKQIQKDTVKSNEEVWTKYVRALIRAAYGFNTLAADGTGAGIENSYAINEIDTSNPLKSLRDPYVEASKFPKEKTVVGWSNHESPVTIGRELHERRNEPTSTFNMKNEEVKRMIRLILKKIDKEFEYFNGKLTRKEILAKMNYASNVKKMVAQFINE